MLQILLPFLFIYIFLATEATFNILNCGLQRLLKRSLVLKHTLIFFSIFFSSFILNWYTPSHIKTEPFISKDMKKNKEQREADARFKLFLKSLFYSIIVYVLFLISTKCETQFFIIIICLVLLLCCIYIYLKIKFNNTLLDKVFKNIFVSEKELYAMIQEMYLSESYNKEIYYWLFVIKLIFLIIFILLKVGVFKYILKQYKSHKKNFNILKFIFGINKCRIRR